MHLKLLVLTLKQLHLWKRTNNKKKISNERNFMRMDNNYFEGRCFGCAVEDLQIEQAMFL
jgi:hypothetical protein